MFVALVLTTWLRNRMRESGLADDYTLDAMLDEVSCIERFEHAGRRPPIGETTEKQREIFCVSERLHGNYRLPLEGRRTIARGFGTY